MAQLSAFAQYYPNCSLSCLVDLIPKSTCVTAIGLNQTCLCTNQIIASQITLCAEQSCNTSQELLTTKNATSTLCHDPVRDESHIITITALVLGCFTFCMFLARIYGRLMTGDKRLHKEDYAMGFTMICSAIPLTPVAYLTGTEGIGRDIWTVAFGKITRTLQFFFICEILYVIGTAATKISILLFLLRMFPVRRLKFWIYGTIGLSLAYGITFFFTILFQCTPMDFSWKQWQIQERGHCIDYSSSTYTASAVNIALDLTVLCLPLRELASLKISTKKRLSVVAMFLVGVFTTVVSAVRLKYLVQFRRTQNPTYDYLAPGFWSLVEVYAGIICACMPAIYALIKHWWPVRDANQGTYGSATKVSSGGFRTPKTETFKTISSNDSEWVRLTEIDPRAGV